MKKGQELQDGLSDLLQNCRVGRSRHGAHFCNLNLTSISYSFWLKIEQFWPFEEISIFSNGGHLGYRTALTDTFLKGDHPRIISAKFG